MLISCLFQYILNLRYAKIKSRYTHKDISAYIIKILLTNFIQPLLLQQVFLLQVLHLQLSL